MSKQDIEGFDAVVHLAGISNDPMGKLKAEKVYDPTREYSLKLAKMCKELGIKFIFASSCSVYGIGGEGKLKEDSTPNPQTPYSLNKYQIESDLTSISDSTFSPIALRFATVFGASPRQRFDVVINMFVGMALTDQLIVLNSDGEAWRPNIYITDVCKTIQQAIELDNRTGGLLVLNVGSNENNLRIIDIAKIVQTYVPKCQIKFLSQNPQLDKEGLIKDRKITSTGSDTRTYQVSFEKLSETFPNFSCEWSIDKGIQEMIKKFSDISLTKSIFKNKNFYRLQQLESLYKKNIISEDLRWVTK